MKESRVSFNAGLAGGFGFYIAWMLVALIWKTSTTDTANIKSIVGFVVGLVVGVVLYLVVYYFANKKHKTIISKRINKNSILGIVFGLIIAFFVGLLLYNPVTLWMPIYGIFGELPGIP